MLEVSLNSKQNIYTEVGIKLIVTHFNLHEIVPVQEHTGKTIAATVFIMVPMTLCIREIYINLYLYSMRLMCYIRLLFYIVMVISLH